ncbi:hypothetical protein I4U23_022259 [Adineta vaga]|nr:hypothetical protein I4U23_022259 [Adineta vaga]
MLNDVRGSHFRGSMISWRVLNETSSSVLLEILQRHAWRYDSYAPYCTDTTIGNGQPLLGSGSNIVCVSTCPIGVSTLGSVAVPCTGYNIYEQYAMGEGRFRISVPRNASFVAAFSSSAWFNLVTGANLAWSVAVRIQTFKRIDTGQYNNAPVITMLPIYRLRQGRAYSLKINVADNDFDPYICLWSQGSTQCGGLSNSVPGGIVDNYGCYLNFTPTAVGFYAAALTVEDFITLPASISSSAYLSQVPIQFVFHVYSSSYSCDTGPVYIGDLVPDICIYVSVGVKYTTSVRFKVQCANTTVDSYISVNPSGLLTTSLQQDPFDPTIFAFLASFTSSISQVGQNLFCFAGIDSIGNQGDSICLRFTVVSETGSLQSLYKANATRYPMGTVSKTTSTWTLFTGTKTYMRPTAETYIRFKRTSDNSDFYVLNVITATSNVLYFSNRLVIISNVTWTPGERFYIHFDSGVFIEASTCMKDAMLINDPNFWSFDIPYETTTSSTSKSIIDILSLLTPTRRTIATSTTTTSVSTSTLTTTTITSYEINLELTDWTSNINEINMDLQHDCLYISMSIEPQTISWHLEHYNITRNFRQMTSLCLSEWPSTWKIQDNTQDQQFTFSRLADLNITIFFDDNPIAAECLDRSDTKEKFDWNIELREKFDYLRPVFLNEEVLIFNGTAHFGSYFEVRNRRAFFVHYMMLEQTHSMSNTCWLSLYCYLGFEIQMDKICHEICSNEHCQEMMNESCADMFYLPSVPIAFGHIYLAYSKQYLIQQKIWTNAPEYICYNEQLCGGFNSNEEILYFNNSLCRRVQDILPNVISDRDAIQMIWNYIHQVSMYLTKCNTILQNDTIICDNQTMYQCLNSSKCIGKIRIFDQFQDCDYGDDEDIQNKILINEICLNEQSSTHFICPNTNKCISRKLIRNSQCDCEYLDIEHLICPDEDIEKKSIREIISFPTICNGFNDLSPIIIDGQNYTDETECDQWICNNPYTRCNGYWDCYDGADEIDCQQFLLDLNCSNHSFLCISSLTHKFICLSMEKGNDGHIDCLGGTDEPHLCRYNTQIYDNGFYCKSSQTLLPICIQRHEICYTNVTCSNMEMSKLCKMNFEQNMFRTGVCDRGNFAILNTIDMRICYLFRFTPRHEIQHFSLVEIKSIYRDEERIPIPVDTLIDIFDPVREHCYRGVPLTVTLDLNKNFFYTTCLCPPNYYGTHCQYQNERVSFTMKLQTFSDSWQIQFLLIISLIDNSYERIIHSYEQITYFPIENCQTSFDIYLIYSNRPKNQTKHYSIHIDIYEKLSLNYRGSFLIHIPFLFLPVQRIASLLNIPYKNYPMKNCFLNECLHGECIRYFQNDKTFCKCFSGWTGQFCTIKYQCNCSLDSICYDRSINQRSICICPIDKWGPRCLISDEICSLNNPCQNNGTCIPYDQHVSPRNTFQCICSKEFYGQRCEYISFKIILSFSNHINIPETMLIHFIQVKNREEPEKGIIFKKIPINRDSIIIYWPKTVHISFVELFLNQYYLIFLEENANQTHIIKKQIQSSDYCPHIREIFNETFAQLHLIRRIKFYHFICRNYSKELSCFYDDIYICFCIQFNNQRQVNCLEFNHTLKRDCSGRSICENGGQCLQDSSICPQTSMCICPLCFYGSQCELTSNGHSLSLDAILGYHIQPFISLKQQPIIVQIIGQYMTQNYNDKLI